MDTDCPECKSPTTAAYAQALDGSVLTCTLCGYIGIWDLTNASGWRTPTGEEHANLLKSEEFLDNMQMSLAIREWRAKDYEKLVAIIKDSLRECLLRNIAHGEPAAETLATIIVANGYHTHPLQEGMQ